MSSLLRRICGCFYKPSVRDKSKLTAGRQESARQEEVCTVAWKSASTSPVDMTGVATCDSVVKKPDDIAQPALKNIAWIGSSEGTQTVEDEGSAAAATASGWDPTQTQIQAEKEKERLPLPWEEVYAKGFVPYDGKTTGPSWRMLPSRTEQPGELEQISVQVRDTGTTQAQRTADTDSLQVQRDDNSVKVQRSVDTSSAQGQRVADDGSTQDQTAVDTVSAQDQRAAEDGSTQGQTAVDTVSTQDQQAAEDGSTQDQTAVDAVSVQGQSAVDTASEIQTSSKGKTAMAQDKSRPDSSVSAVGDAEVKTANVKKTQAEITPEQTPGQATIQAKQRAKQQVAAIKLTNQ